MAEIKLISSNGVRGVLDKLIPSFETASGCTVSIVYGASLALQERIERGATFDLAILTADGIDTLIGRRHLAPPAVAIAASGIAVAVRAGAPKPDIGTPEAFRDALLAAKSVGHSTRGASGVYFMELIERLGIADEVRAKAKTPAAGMVGDLVARGEAELGIQQLSELLPVAGLDIVGPLPDELQRFTTFSAALSPTAREPDGANALIRFSPRRLRPRSSRRAVCADPDLTESEPGRGTNALSAALPNREAPATKLQHGWPMNGHGGTDQHIAQNLRHAVDRLHRDIEKVEIWAGALSAFLQPIPDYELPHEYVLAHQAPEETEPEG